MRPHLTKVCKLVFCLILLQIAFSIPVFQHQIPNNAIEQNVEFQRTRIESIRINGTTYVIVDGLKLPFLKAEKYCQSEFPTSMHLASISSEEEWNFLREHLKDIVGSADIWLGGILTKNEKNDVSLDWIDHTKVKYHNLTDDQLTFLSKEMKSEEPKPLIGDVGSGMWSVELLENHELNNMFICKTHEYSTNGPYPTFRLGFHRFPHFIGDNQFGMLQDILGSMMSDSSLFSQMFQMGQLGPVSHTPYWRRRHHKRVSRLNEPNSINLGSLKKQKKIEDEEENVNSVNGIVPKDAL